MLRPTKIGSVPARLRRARWRREAAQTTYGLAIDGWGGYSGNLYSFFWGGLLAIPGERPLRAPVAPSQWRAVDPPSHRWLAVTAKALANSAPNEIGEPRE